MVCYRGREKFLLVYWVSKKKKKVHLGFSIRAHGKIQMNFLTNPIASWGKIMTNLGSILKRRDVILLTKVHIVKALVFPVVMYGCESWTIRKAEH